MRSFTSFVALAFAACASALTISTPASASAGAPITIVWERTRSNDPESFTLFLLDDNNLPFGLKQNFGSVNTADGHATFVLDGDLSSDITYVIRAVRNENLDIVLASSAAFTLS